MVDEDGTYAIGQLATTVRNSSPEIDSLEGDVSGDEGDQFHFSATAHDPAGVADTLTYVWFFGDGSDYVSGVGLTEVDHRFADSGDYSVTLIVADEDDGGELRTLEVTVDNVGPQFEAGSDQTLWPAIQGIFARSGITFTDPGDG